jgi:hypothetical protein
MKEIHLNILKMLRLWMLVILLSNEEAAEKNS